MTMRVQHMTMGQHGVHIHETGLCVAPIFESAGDHWDPVKKKHGLENSKGPHTGDMPNVVVGKNGDGSLSFTFARRHAS